MTRPILVGLALREDDAAPLALARALARLGDFPVMLVTAYPRATRGELDSPEYEIAARRAAREVARGGRLEPGG